MRFHVSLSAAIMLAVLVLAGCNSKDTDRASVNSSATTSNTRTTPARQQRPPSDGAPRITPQELNDALNKGAAVVVDVRNSAAFNQSRIKGAILIPVSEIGNRTDELPRDKMIVTYCA